jgi:hypothetical protein
VIEPRIRLLLAFDKATTISPHLQSAQGITDALTLLSLDKNSKVTKDLETDFEIFLMLVDARTGISPAMVDVWQSYAERQFPRLLLVQGLEFAESDFDDIVLIGNRVLEQFATPFLVLHDDLGQPTALISLEDNLVHDYSGALARRYSAESELVDIVADFQEEYLQLYSDLGEDGFQQGIFAIALPVGIDKKFGIAELNSILEVLAKR